jgi:tellurium resistance protein TerZ
MLMGILYKKNGEWKFNAIGEPTKDRKLEDTVKTVTQSYL